jgi:hypothetical protein
MFLTDIGTHDGTDLAFAFGVGLVAALDFAFASAFALMFLTNAHARVTMMKT